MKREKSKHNIEEANVVSKVPNLWQSRIYDADKQGSWCSNLHALRQPFFQVIWTTLLTKALPHLISKLIPKMICTSIKPTILPQSVWEPNIVSGLWVSTSCLRRRATNSISHFKHFSCFTNGKGVIRTVEWKRSNLLRLFPRWTCTLLKAATCQYAPHLASNPDFRARHSRTANCDFVYMWALKCTVMLPGLRVKQLVELFQRFSHFWNPSGISGCKIERVAALIQLACCDEAKRRS